jgi:hypothetical protein
MMNTVSNALQNPKIATLVSAGTGATGTATMFDWIPGDIGKLASLIGLVLSLVFGYFAIEKAIEDRKNRKLVREELEKRLKR